MIYHVPKRDSQEDELGVTIAVSMLCLIVATIRQENKNKSNKSASLKFAVKCKYVLRILFREESLENFCNNSVITEILLTLLTVFETLKQHC